MIRGIKKIIYYSPKNKIFIQDMNNSIFAIVNKVYCKDDFTPLIGIIYIDNIEYFSDDNEAEVFSYFAEELENKLQNIETEVYLFLEDFVNFTEYSYVFTDFKGYKIEKIWSINDKRKQMEICLVKEISFGGVNFKNKIVKIKYGLGAFGKEKSVYILNEDYDLVIY